MADRSSFSDKHSDAQKTERKPWATPHVITSDLGDGTEKVTAVTDSYSQGPS
jgi:hypothetical protein